MECMCCGTNCGDGCLNRELYMEARASSRLARRAPAWSCQTSPGRRGGPTVTFVAAAVPPVPCSACRACAARRTAATSASRNGSTRLSRCSQHRARATVRHVTTHEPRAARAGVCAGASAGLGPPHGAPPCERRAPFLPASLPCRCAGLRCKRALATGEFVIEYCGEVINDREFVRRTEAYEDDDHFYFMQIGARNWRVIPCNI